MEYTSESHISTVEEVTLFFHHIVFDRHIEFHPDDDFSEYVGNDFASEEVELYNRLMQESFTVCEGMEDPDIYDMGWEQLASGFEAEVI